MNLSGIMNLILKGNIVISEDGIKINNVKDSININGDGIKINIGKEKLEISDNGIIANGKKAFITENDSEERRISYDGCRYIFEYKNGKVIDAKISGICEKRHHDYIRAILHKIKT